MTRVQLICCGATKLQLFVIKPPPDNEYQYNNYIVGDREKLVTAATLCRVDHWQTAKACILLMLVIILKDRSQDFQGGEVPEGGSVLGRAWPA